MPATNLSRPSTRHHPYTKDFDSLSLPQKSKIATSIIQFAQHRTSNWISALKYVFGHTHQGRKQLNSTDLQYNQLLRRIAAMHTMAPIKYRAAILALVSRSHSEFQLRSYGFQFSRKQLQNSRKKADNHEFQLLVKNTMPPSRQQKSASVKNLVIEYLTRFSNPSSNNCGGEQVFILNHTKKHIYEILKKENPEVILSRSTFYSLCPKKFKKATKKQICALFV